MKLRRSLALALTLALVGLACACHDGSPGPSAGSNSNWLTACDSDAQCSTATACQCGGCTRSCGSDVDCGDLEGARCVLREDAPVKSMCPTGAPDAGLCLPRCTPGSCGADQICVLGACVLAGSSDSALCATDSPGSEERTRAEELLEVFEELRLQGGSICGSDAATEAAPALRYDARLSCAARALAGDLNMTRRHSLTDSEGRSSSERMREAGYSARLWGEAYSFGAATAATALSNMLSDATACRGLSAAALTDVGVAHVGDVDVITTAAQ